MSEASFPELDANYWDQRWRAKATGWDIGYASPAIIEYFQKVGNKDVRILIPGCGNAWEGERLFELGFKNITLLDVSESAKRTFLERVDHFDPARFFVGDFFTFNGQFDYIVEQTFFCAIHPKRRGEYVRHSFDLLAPEGKLIGLLFDCNFEQEGPPYGGSREEYESQFLPLFRALQLEKTSKSIPPRMGRELFIELQKPAPQSA